MPCKRAARFYGKKRLKDDFGSDDYLRVGSRNMISGDSSLRITDPNGRVALHGRTSMEKSLKYSWSLALLFILSVVFFFCRDDSHFR